MFDGEIGLLIGNCLLFFAGFVLVLAFAHFTGSWKIERIKMLNQFSKWMNERRESVAAQRRSKLRRKLLQICRDMRNTSNQGLLKRQLWKLPGIQKTTLESGGWQSAIVQIWMSDGFEITAREPWLNDAIRTAAARVIQRIRATRF